MPAKTAGVCAEGIRRNCSFDYLPDDLLIAIMAKLASTATSPSHLINAMLTCRRFCCMAKHPHVIRHASIGSLSVRASKWSEGAYQFLKRCAEAGNSEACYTLGMISFYCLMKRGSGMAFMAVAAMASHPVAVHSLAVIHFNGSGGSKKDKNTGVILCAKAAALGHVDAIRELGLCLQDGYGVKKNVAVGRRFLLEANAREAEANFVHTLSESASSRCCHGSCPGPYLQLHSDLRRLGGSPDTVGRNQHPQNGLLDGSGGSLLSDFGCNVPSAKVHLANAFLVEWFALHPPPPGFRICSHSKCGRPETRRHEFRICSACGLVNYCSRACQALDWKSRHRYNCASVADWEDQEEIDLGEEDGEDHSVADGLYDA